MHPVTSHDLPNQAVALQGLLQLFEWDEAMNLTPQGHEYFGRLQSIATKTMALVQYLKELARLQRYSPIRTNLALPLVAEELLAEARRLFPDRQFTLEGRWSAESVFADHRLVQQGVRQLLRAALPTNVGGSVLMQMQTVAHADQVEWLFTVMQTHQPVVGSAPTDAALLDRGLEWALAQECLAVTDIVCRRQEQVQPGVTTYSLLIGKRSPHD